MPLQYRLAGLAIVAIVICSLRYDSKFVQRFMVLMYIVTNEIIRIYHECECGIENRSRGLPFLHHVVCQVMSNRDHEGRNV